MAEQHRKVTHPDYWHTTSIQPTFEELQRFMGKIEVVDVCGNGLGPCWVWQGNYWKNYGSFHCQGGSGFAHRIAYRMFKGEIPYGLIIDHICENRKCVNPVHLRAVTLSQNNLLHHRRRDKRTLPLPFDKGGR